MLELPAKLKRSVVLDVSSSGGVGRGRSFAAVDCAKGVTPGAAALTIINIIVIIR